jgi:ferritin-like metal-binding protein YciE
MAKEKTLQDLFLDTLKDIYFAEKKILTALPKMAKAATSDELRAAFEKHEAETEQQVSRLEQVFAEIDETPKGKNCPAILGIIEEGQEIMKEYKVIPRSMPGCCRPPRRSSTTKSPATARSRLGQASSVLTRA